MKTKTNRLLSLLLCCAMVLGMLPAMSLMAFAAEPGISITGSTADSSGTGWSYYRKLPNLDPEWLQRWLYPRLRA